MRVFLDPAIVDDPTLEGLRGFTPQFLASHTLACGPSGIGSQTPRLPERRIATVTLRPIELGKPNQNAYVESFNSRLRDECLNELVHESGARTGRHRKLAVRVQREET